VYGCPTTALVSGAEPKTGALLSTLIVSGADVPELAPPAKTCMDRMLYEPSASVVLPSVVTIRLVFALVFGAVACAILTPPPVHNSTVAVAVTFVTKKLSVLPGELFKAVTLSLALLPVSLSG
jgi:hypothetical protein